MHTIAYTFNLWSINWQYSALSIYTNSMVVYYSIKKTVIRNIANKSLYKILLAAIAYNITLSVKWILGNLNGLANTLS